MKSKGHLAFSLAKSAIRIVGAVAAAVLGSVVVLAVSFGAAELLGVAEELVDKRD